MSSLWIAGAALALLASCVTNAGVNTQKYSFLKNEKLDTSNQKTYMKQPLYLIGLCMVFVGSLGDFAALALAAQSIVAPMAAVTLVTNVAFAHFILKEQMYRRDLIGTALIVIGCVLSIAFGDHNEVSLDINTINQYFDGTPFQIYAVFFCVLCVILYGSIRYVEPMRKQLSDTQKRYHEAVEIGDDELALQEDAHILHLSGRYKRYVKIHPFAYCSLSGILGANSILFGKMVAECIKTSITGNDQMANGYFFIYLICMIVFIIMQLHFLALGLAIFDSLYVVPVFQCFFITVSTLGGACFFLEFNTFDTTQAVIFPFGLVLTLCGVYLLSMRAGVQAEQLEQKRCSVAQRSEMVSRVSQARSMRENSIAPLTPHHKSTVNHSGKLFTELSVTDRGEPYINNVSMIARGDSTVTMNTRTQHDSEIAIDVSNVSRQGSLRLPIDRPPVHQQKYLKIPFIQNKKLHTSSSLTDLNLIHDDNDAPALSSPDSTSDYNTSTNLIKSQSQHNIFARQH